MSQCYVFENRRSYSNGATGEWFAIYEDGLIDHGQYDYAFSRDGHYRIMANGYRVEGTPNLPPQDGKYAPLYWDSVVSVLDKLWPFVGSKSQTGRQLYQLINEIRHLPKDQRYTTFMNKVTALLPEGGE